MMFTRYLPDTAILLRRPYFCFLLFALHEMEGESFRGKQMLVGSFGMECDSMFEMVGHLSEQKYYSNGFGWACVDVLCFENNFADVDWMGVKISGNKVVLVM